MFLRSTDSPRLGGATGRSVTLLQRFLLASAALLVLGGLALSSVLTHSLKTQALADRRTSLTEYVDGVLRADLVQNGRLRVAPSISARLLGELRRQPELVTVKVWRSDGTLVWASRGQDRIGKRFPLTGKLGEAIRENRAAGDIDQLDSDEDALEASLGYDHLLEVYAPIASRGAAKPVGAYEIYADPAGLESAIASRRHLIWIAVAAVFGALYALLALLVRTASRTLRRQTLELRQRSAALLEAYERLEHSSLEAIESLNATVDAKDPYTAGHSQRVQRIALAIGEELGLPEQRLDTLRFGGLFHDIGKLGVPDAVLTKPGRLTDEEFERIKRHAEDGARIVQKFGRLREAVPAIRHHHERWDGSGYPDGLAGTAIPLEAAIIGLADAWDAMTTDRPYSRARTAEGALAEVRRGRGSQFSPAVVDAFLAAAWKHPDVFRLDVLEYERYAAGA
jgi:putative nucleotidyltransferase with HDIG domain